ncbi:MAG: SDR family oxidoreductase [Pseudomonadota bacterium]
MSMEIMRGKRGLIMGLANDKSIAWGIAKALHGAGAEIAITYHGAAMEKRVKPLAEILQSPLVMECDASNPTSVDAAMTRIGELWDGIDFIVHAIGFSDKNELRGRYLDTTRANFALTMDISVYSFTSVLQQAEPLLNPGSSALTLSYYGAEKWMPNYNVMGVAKAALEASVMYLAADLGPKGVRVNAISAGTIKTLAASGIGDFRAIMNYNEASAPLRRTVSQEEVGRSALYLLSDLGSAVTGEVLHVDAGFHIVGMRPLEKD